MRQNGGHADVEIGHPEFDKQFIIKGNDEAQLRQLFANSRIRQLIGEQHDIRFSVTHGDAALWGGTSIPDGFDELHYEVVGLITDVEHLLFTTSSTKLSTNSSASALRRINLP